VDVMTNRGGKRRRMEIEDETQHPHEKNRKPEPVEQEQGDGTRSSIIDGETHTQAVDVQVYRGWVAQHVGEYLGDRECGWDIVPRQPLCSIPQVKSNRRSNNWSWSWYW